jgi:peptide/nickel transport system substrate-binding protein
MPTTDRPAGQVAVRSPQKAITVGFATEPPGLDRTLAGGASGVNDWAAFLNGFLTYTDPDTQARPYLAAELPSVERGTWKMLPGGLMETTYRLRPEATWHDGKPVTAHDFVFAHTVRTDPGVAAAYTEVERRIARATALDDRTLFLEWKEPYLWAGMISTPNFAPLPKHLFEELYLSAKETIGESAFLRTEFVGSGPYKLGSWQQGVELTLRAHDGFVFGKPPVDQIVVKFITDANTIVANLLSGAIDIGFHSSIGFPQGQSLEQAGWSGTVEFWRGNPRYFEFQTRDWGNLQNAVLDVRVRQAMMHAIDRQTIIDGLYAGRAVPIHFWLPLEDPAYAAVDRAVTRYEYDPRRSETLLRDGGWSKGGDGIARNASGDTLHMPLLNESQDIDQLEAAVVGDYWKAIGITSEIHRVTRQQQGDGEFRSKFAAVSYSRRTLEYETMGWTRAGVSRPENRWLGISRSGYTNPVLDENWTRALGTIDARQREPLFVEALKAMTADAVVTPTHLQPRVMAHKSDLVGMRDNSQNGGALVWNIWEWHWN